MEEKTQEFIDEVLKGRKTKLLGLATDIAFFDVVLDLYPEDSLRKELKAENEKVIKDDKGERVVEDNRDMNKVKDLEKSIAKAQQAQKQKDQFVGVYNDVLRYIAFIEENIEEKDSKLINKLDLISKE